MLLLYFCIAICIVEMVRSAWKSTHVLLVCVFVCLFVCLFACLLVCLSVCLFCMSYNGRVGWGARAHDNVVSTCSATCCYGAQISGCAVSLYTLSRWSAVFEGQHMGCQRVFVCVCVRTSWKFVYIRVEKVSCHFTNQRSSPGCEVLAVDVCESAYPSAANTISTLKRLLWQERKN